MKDSSPKKQNALLDAYNEINKTHGDGSIMPLGSKKMANIETISTGSISLDEALGGGIPVGRIIELFGEESSGKSTLSLHVISEFQKLDKHCVYIDAEHAVDSSYAKKIGVDIEKLMISQPDSGEQALEIVEKLIKTKKVDLIVVDSIAALAPRAELEGEMGASLPGLQARMMGQAMRKLTAITAKSGCTLLFTNQVRMKIGVSFGDPTTTPGGNAMKFYASVRMKIWRRKALEEIRGKDKVAIASPTTVKVVKNKVAAPFKKAEFEIKYNVGIDKVSDVIDSGLKFGVFSQSGPYITMLGKKHHGKDRAKKELENKDELEKARKAVVSFIENVNPSTVEIIN